MRKKGGKKEKKKKVLFLCKGICIFIEICNVTCECERKMLHKNGVNVRQGYRILQFEMLKEFHVHF